MYNVTMPNTNLYAQINPFVDEKAKALSQIYIDLDAELRSNLINATQQAVAGDWNLRRSAALLSQTEKQLQELQVNFQIWNGATLPEAAGLGGAAVNQELKKYKLNQENDNTWNRLNKEAIDALAADIAGLHGQFLGVIPTPEGKTSILRQIDDYLRILGGKEIARGLGLGLGSDEVARAMRTKSIDRLRGGQPLQQLAAGVDNALGMIDKAGREWSLHRYGRMAAQTGMMRAINEGSANKLLQAGQHVYKVSSHGTLCYICKPYEGKVFALDAEGEARGYPKLNRDVPFHPHCMHSISPAILEILPPGDSYPTMTKEEINKTDKDRYKQMKQNYPELMQAAGQGFSKEAEWERFKATAKDAAGNPVPIKDLRGGNFRYRGIEKRRLAATANMIANANLSYAKAMDTQTRKFMGTKNYLAQRTATTPTQQRAITNAAKKPGGGVVLNQNPYLNGTMPPGSYHKLPPDLPPVVTLTAPGYGATVTPPATNSVMPSIKDYKATDYNLFKTEFKKAWQYVVDNYHSLNADEVAAAIDEMTQKKKEYKNLLSEMKLSELKEIAKADKITNWAFATKDDLIILMTETSDVMLKPTTDALAAKVTAYAESSAAKKAAKAAEKKAAKKAGAAVDDVTDSSGISALTAEEQAALDNFNAAFDAYNDSLYTAAAQAAAQAEAIAAQEAANAAAAWQAANDSANHVIFTELNKLNSIQKAAGETAPWLSFKEKLQELRTIFYSQSEYLTAQQIAEFETLFVEGEKIAFKNKLDALTLKDLKVIAKDSGIKNWAFTTKEEIITLMSEIAPDKTDPITKALQAKVDGYAAAKKAKAKAKKAAADNAPVVPEIDAPGVIQSPVITSPDFDVIDANWAQTVADNADNYFDYVGNAQQLGGVHDKYIYSDPQGNRWLFKPMREEFLSLADEMTYKIGRLFDPDAVEIRNVTLGGRNGSIQRMKMGLEDNINYEGVAVTAINEDEIKQLQQKHVIDWLMSNHDGHAENFLRMANGNVVEIDQAQVYKFFGRDKLDINYNPNATGQHPRTLYNDIFHAVKNGQMTVDPLEALKTIQKIEALADNDFLDLLDKYALKRFANNDNKYLEFLTEARKRKQNIRADFEKFYSDVLNKPGFTFDTMQAEARAVNTTQRVAAAAPDSDEWKQWAQYLEDVKKLGGQGKEFPFDTDMIEEQNLLTYIEKLPNGSSQTVMRVKIRPERESELLNLLNNSGGTPGTPGVPIGSIHPDDNYYETVKAAAKTINHHITQGDTAYNQSKLNAALSLRDELRNIVYHQTVDAEKEAMAKYYLEMITDIQTASVSSSPEALPFFEQYRTRAVIGGTPAIPATNGGLNISYKGNVRIPKKVTQSGDTVNTQTVFDSYHDAMNKPNYGSKDGLQYTIDLGDGYEATYLPWGHENYYAESGKLEIRWAGQPTTNELKEVFGKMSNDLKIPAFKAAGEDMELLYLHKQAYVTLETKTPAYRNMISQLDARGASNAERIQKMREYWNGKLGVEDVTKLPDYNPLGEYQTGFKDNTIDGGRRITKRFDISEAQINEEMKDYRIYMAVTANNGIDDLINLMMKNNGVLAANVEKLRIGVPGGGWSPIQDLDKGGANFVFTRIFNKDTRESGLFFKPNMLRRMDAISYDHDAYGNCVGDFVEQNRKTTINDFRSRCAIRPRNETDFKNSISFLDNIDIIKCNGSAQKEKIIKAFHDLNITRLPDGRLIKNIVKCL